MQTVIKNPRSGCALHGALQTAEEIKGTVPIVHSNPGCAIHSYLGNKAGGLGKGYVSGYDIPSTSSMERHIIFGGASRLREQIKNTVKTVNGDLYLVLNSCQSAMVGDDVEAMTQEAADQGYPVLSCLTAGFHGDSHYGYSALFTALIKKLPALIPSREKKEKRLVNIFGILPRQDLYFKGDLDEIRRILEGIGLKANTFFGPQNGVNELAEIPNASLNIVFSKWGIQSVRLLEEKYHIPYFVLPAPPAGIFEVEDFVKQVAERTGLDEEDYLPFLEKEKAKFHYYYHDLSDIFFERGLNKYAAVVGDESTVRRTVSLLKNYLGAIVKAAIITDFFPDEEIPYQQKNDDLKSYAQEVYFSQDEKEIRDILFHSDIEFILGSSLEKEIADKKKISFLPVSYPAYHTAVVNKTYTGNEGALQFLEDYITAVEKTNQERNTDLPQQFTNI